MKNLVEDFKNTHFWIRTRLASGSIYGFKQERVGVTYGSGGGMTVAGYGGSSMKVQTDVEYHADFWVKVEDGPDFHFFTQTSLPVADGQMVEIFEVTCGTHTLIEEGMVGAVIHNKSTNTFVYVTGTLDTKKHESHIKKICDSATFTNDCKEAAKQIKELAAKPHRAIMRKTSSLPLKIVDAVGIGAFIYAFIAENFHYMWLALAALLINAFLYSQRNESKEWDSNVAELLAEVQSQASKVQEAIVCPVTSLPQSVA